MTGSLWGKSESDQPGEQSAATPPPAPPAPPAPPTQPYAPYAPTSPVSPAPAAPAGPTARPGGRGRLVATASLAAVLGFAAGVVFTPYAARLSGGWRPQLPLTAPVAAPGATATPAASPPAQPTPAQPTPAQPTPAPAQPTPAPAQPTPAPAQPTPAQPTPAPAQPGQQPPGQGTPDTQQAVRTVIDRANAAQAQAIASGDPTVMADTATRDHYRSMVETNQDLVADGVKKIELVDVQWGPVVVRGDTATATTVETWRTTYGDGTTDQSSDRNVYSLQQTAAGWKIGDNQHPDATPLAPGGGFPAIPGFPMPGSPAAPSQPGQQPPAPAQPGQQPPGRQGRGDGGSGGNGGSTLPSRPGQSM